MKSFRICLMLSIVIFVLPSCSLLSPVKIIPQHKYLLTAIPCDISCKPRRNIVVLVTMPTSRPIFNTIQMAYSLRPYHIAYFRDNVWAETPPEMLQPLIMQTLEQTHYFHAILNPPYLGHYDYILNTQLLSLRQDFSQGCPCLIMAVRVQIQNKANRVLADREFTVSQAFKPATPYAGVWAANLATKKMLRNIAALSLNVMR